MKKIVNSKRYDTETATEIDSWEYGYPNDHRHVYEVLYRTASGAYFLYGKGGPASDYAVKEGNTSWGSEDIRPLTREQSKEWLQDHDLTDALESEFSDEIIDA